MPYSGHTVQFGVDTSASPNMIQSRVFASDAVNRTFRTGLNRTRPPFNPLSLWFQSEKERELFEKSNVTGVYGYSGIFPYTSSHIIVTAGKYVFAGQLLNGNISFRIIWDNLNPYYSNQYFCQAENILVISDGKSDPLFWNGQTTRMSYCKDSKWIVANIGGEEGRYPMPKFNAMVYAHGRIFGATETGAVFVSDHIYSQGINASNEAVLRFSESTYPSSGDGFTAPASFGDLTGIAVTYRGQSTNGHGEIVVFHLLGAYSINPLPPRNEWSTMQIQQILFTGIGGCSPESIINSNNDIFFRCSNRSISSLRELISDINNQSTIRPVSQEVQKYVEFDNFYNLRYSMAGISDNRVLFTVNHKVEPDENDERILHRYAMGLVALDLYRGSNSATDQRSWDGLWNGLRITGIASLTIGKERDCYFCSRDIDGINRIYSLSKFQGNDIKGIDLSESLIYSFYTVDGIFSSLRTDQDDINEVIISNSIFFYSELIGGMKASCSYTSNNSQYYQNIYSSEEISGDGKSNLLLDRTFSGRFISPTIERNEDNFGAISYKMSFVCEGSVCINANYLMSDTVTALNAVYDTPCSSTTGSSSVIPEDINYFNYYL